MNGPHMDPGPGFGQTCFGLWILNVCVSQVISDTAFGNYKMSRGVSANAFLSFNVHQVDLLWETFCSGLLPLNNMKHFFHKIFVIHENLQQEVLMAFRFALTGLADEIRLPPGARPLYWSAPGLDICHQRCQSHAEVRWPWRHWDLRWVLSSQYVPLVL